MNLTGDYFTPKKGRADNALIVIRESPAIPKEQRQSSISEVHPNFASAQENKKRRLFNK